MVEVTELEATRGCILGEGPHWDSSRKCLFFVDIAGPSVLKYVPSTNKLTKASLEKIISFVVPVDNTEDQFVVSQANELVLISWDGKSDKVTILEKLDSVEATKYFNDAKCDSAGRLWAGAHSVDPKNIEKTEPLGVLYSMDASKQLTSHVDNIKCSNGMAFDDKTKKMYYIDTLKRTVDKFDFDVTTGTPFLANREVWFSLEKLSIPGYPDGMTIDSDGNLWVAIFPAGRVLKISGSKCETLLDTVELPTEQVTSVTFGGESLDELYVTTGATTFQGEGPSASAKGAIYRVKGTGVKGLPAVNFNLSQ